MNQPDYECGFTQLEDLLRANDIPPPPPRHLQERVVGGYFSDFMRSGDQTIADFDAALVPTGRTVASFSTVLDLGCGCGRVLRRMAERMPKARLVGADIDSEAIAWLRNNYSRYGDFIVAQPKPPLDLPDNTFDLVYAVSVFTHLPEDMQFEWLAELNRVTAPGGILLLTVRDVPGGGGSGFKFVDADSTEGLPDFYKTTYHTKDYVWREWSRYFDLLNFAPNGLTNANQDFVVCQKRKYWRRSAEQRHIEQK